MGNVVENNVTLKKMPIKLGKIWRHIFILLWPADAIVCQNELGHDCSHFSFFQFDDKRFPLPYNKTIKTYMV